MAENKEGPSDPGRRTLILGGLAALGASIAAGLGIKGTLDNKQIAGENIPVKAPTPGEETFPTPIVTPPGAMEQTPTSEPRVIPTPPAQEQAIPNPSPPGTPAPAKEGTVAIQLNPFNLSGAVFYHQNASYAFYLIAIFILALAWLKRSTDKFKSIS